MNQPKRVGADLERTVGQLYHDQMLAAYWEASEQITLNALVMLCLTAREFDATVMYVLLEDSDQGEWQVVTGLSANVPQYAGHYATELDRDREDLFEDHGWSSSINDRTEDTWLAFTVETEFLPGLRLLDVTKVLAEVDLPWRPTKVGA